MSGLVNGFSNVSQKWLSPVPNVSIWDAGKWAVFDPLNIADTRLGPEFSFIHELVNSGHGPFGIIKLSKPATYLATDWRAKNGRLYKKLVKEVRNAGQENKIKIKGVLWVQGEADAIDEVNAKNYRSNLEHFVTSLRNDLKIEEAPFIAAVVNPPLDICPYVFLVNEAQRKNSLSNYHTVECHDLPKRRDNLHYSVRGLSKLGKRLASEVLKLETVSETLEEYFYTGDLLRLKFNGYPIDDGKLVLCMPHAVV